jgi:hypothetical protein
MAEVQRPSAPSEVRRQVPLSAVPAADPATTTRLYAPQFEAAEALLGTVWESRPEGVEIDGIGDVRILLLHVFGRGTQSYQGVLALCRAGLPDQAYMICRSLYEDMIASYWARLDQNRDGLVERVLRQEKHWDERQDRAFRSLGTQVPDDPMSEEEWNRLQDEFSGGTKSWFGRLAAAEKRVFDSVDAEELGWLQHLSEVHHNAENMTLHTTVEGLTSGAGKPLRYEGRFYFSYEAWRTPDERRMQRSLFAAGEYYSRIATQLFTEFEIDLSHIADARERARWAFFKLLPSQRRSLGPNDRCWCGSGLKLKKCHEI